MPDTKPGAPLDLSIFDNLDSSTPTIYEAREIAIERMQFEAAAAKAEGVVGVDIREGSYGWHTHVIEFFAIGTAVVQNEHLAEGQQLPDITPVLDLNN